MSKEKQIDIIIDLLTEFDEMGFAPTVPCPDSEAYAIKWRDEMTRALIGYRKQSEWISVDERLPKNFDAVLAVTKNGNPFVCRYDHGFERWAVSGRVNVTHWMPLPEAPKGGE